MKTLVIFLLLIFPFQGYSQEIPQDSLKILQLEAKVDTLQNINNQLKVEKEKLESKIKEDVDSSKSIHDFFVSLYILMPVILSFGAGLYFLKRLRIEGYKISNALSDDVPEERLEKVQTEQIAMARTRADIVAANALNPANPQAVPAPIVVDATTLPMNRSSSRLIAFLSSMSASILAICIFSYYMYFAIKGMPIPDFEDLWSILAALGLGIVPYATKVINEKKGN